MFDFRSRFPAPATVLVASLLAGCAAQDIENFNRQLTALSQGVTVPGAAAAGGLARQPAASGKTTELVIPNDRTTAAAMEAALPNIKKVLAIHQCINDPEGVRQLNFYAVPGVDMYKASYTIVYPMRWMQYHDRNKCLSVRAIDQWSMPALNALTFRAVHFADDSGETFNFFYRFMRMDDGSWKLESTRLATS